MSQRNQKTINDTIKFQGVGLHNGINANLIVKPAKENFGIKFCRTDVSKENIYSTILSKQVACAHDEIVCF